MVVVSDSESSAGLWAAAPSPPPPRAKRALGAQRSSYTRQSRVERACERNPPQGAASLCVRSPKGDPKHKLAVTEDNYVGCQRCGAKRPRVNRDPTSVRGGRLTRGERSSPRQANQAAPKSPPRVTIGASCSYRRDVLSSRPEPRLCPRRAPVGPPAGITACVSGGRGEETVTSRRYRQVAPMLALGGDFGAAWFACLGFILHPLVSLPRRSSSGHDSPLGRFAPYWGYWWFRPRSRTPRRALLKSAKQLLSERATRPAGDCARRLAPPSCDARSCRADALRARFARGLGEGDLRGQSSELGPQ